MRDRFATESGARPAWPYSLVLGLVLALGPASGGAEGQQPTGLDLPVVEHTLANGMTFLILPRPGAPTAAFVTHYDVGSVNEALGHTGIAHMLEHLLFKGTTTIGTRNLERELRLLRQQDAVNDSLRAELARPGVPDTARIEQLRTELAHIGERSREYVVSNEFDEILTRHGARDMNAVTTHEATKYFVQLPANKLELWFVLEADRMRNPVFREFYAERNVVAEERRSRLETTAGGALSEAFYATAYQVHPYGVPVAGHMSDIQGYTREQVESYYRRYYGPNNAVVAIVGDVDPDEAIRYAEAYFGPIPRRDEPPRLLAVEPPQRGERRIEIIFDAQPELIVGWHVPDGSHPDAPALSVLSSILAGGRTSRLDRRLIQEERAALGVSASIGPGVRYPLLFTISAQPQGESTTAQLEAAIYEEVDRIRREPPAPEEVRRVVNQIQAGEVRRLQSPLGLAFQLADSETYHDDWRETFRAWRDFLEVTPEDVRRVAETYLRAENRTVGWTRRPEDAP